MQLRTLFLAIGLASSAAALANPPAPPVIIPLDQLQQERVLQTRQLNNAGRDALQSRANLTELKCWKAVEAKSRWSGPVLFESVRTDMEDRLYVRGRVHLPDENGQAVAFDYECRMDAEKDGFDSITLSQSEDEALQ